MTTTYRVRTNFVMPFETTNRNFVRGAAYDTAWRVSKVGTELYVYTGVFERTYLSLYTFGADGRWHHVTGAKIEGLDGATREEVYALQHPGQEHVTPAYCAQMVATLAGEVYS